MKKIKILFGFVALFAFVAMAAFGMPEAVETFIGIGSVGIGTSLALVPWMELIENVEEFKELSKVEKDALTDDQYEEYTKAKYKGLEGKLTKLIAEQAKATEERSAQIQKEVYEVKDAQYATVKQQLKDMVLVVERLKESGMQEDSPTFKGELKKAWDENLKTLEDLKSGGSHSMMVKATQTYGDIDSGLDFAQFKPGITDIPVRKTIFKSLFNTIPLSTESLKYTEQETVNRNAQNVAKCSEVTSTTKETLKVSSIDVKVVQDELDFCRMFISDFAFMATRINKLINESIGLKSDQQVLLGTGTGEETFSISSVSSEFDDTNVVCVLTDKIQAPNLVDLISGMATQIFELGKQNAYMPNIAIVNNCDWFTDVASLKDQNDNYLDTRVTTQGGKTFIITLAGLIEVVTSPLVGQNTCYVLDSTKGDIVDRMETQIDVSFENKDNFVKHIGTLLGWVRFNFLVENNNANAFMKCSNITVALAAILKP